MHKYTAKLSLLLLIILEASIYDEGVLSEGVLSGRNLCLDGVMYGGAFVRGGFVLPSGQWSGSAVGPVNKLLWTVVREGCRTGQQTVVDSGLGWL